MPGDKSISHRALIVSAMAEGTSRIGGLSRGLDVRATERALTALGVEIEETGSGDVTVRGGAWHEPEQVIDVGNSGTTLRLMAGAVAGRPFMTVLTGDRSIVRRPVDRVADPLRQMGATVLARAGGRLPPLVVCGGALRGITYRLPVPSAQVAGAVLLAGLSARGPTTVVDMPGVRRHTEELLAAAGADIRREGDTVTLRPSDLHPIDVEVPGDPSQAAFWLVAAAVTGGRVTVEGLYTGAERLAYLDVLRRMGAEVVVDTETGRVTVGGGGLVATHLAPDEVPAVVDEVPILAVAAAVAEGESRLEGLGELRVKESDRVETVARMLTCFGVSVRVEGDSMVIRGGVPLRGATVDAAGDHRIAMAAAVAGLAATGRSRVDGWEVTATSYPGFADGLSELAPASSARIEGSASR